MSATVIDGNEVAREIQQGLKIESAALREQGIEPTLAVVLAGDDPASHTYVRGKIKMAKRLGIRSLDHLLPASVPQQELLDLVQSLNDDPTVHGVLVQLPLPAHIDPHAVLVAVDPRKDVDGFHPINVGSLVSGG